LIILVETNIGKALGNYICDWGQLDYNLIVIDEVALRSAQFAHIGRVHQGMIPVSFFGLN
jgi:ethanolamine utilization protein EutA (predicted chaperonin)